MGSGDSARTRSLHGRYPLERVRDALEAVERRDVLRALVVSG
jgi:hypothetical protein